MTDNYGTSGVVQSSSNSLILRDADPDEAPFSTSSGSLQEHSGQAEGSQSLPGPSSSTEHASQDLDPIGATVATARAVELWPTQDYDRPLSDCWFVTSPSGAEHGPFDTAAIRQMVWMATALW